MSLSSHLSELRRKHATLDQRLEAEIQSPAADDLQIKALKQEKLRLKDQIERLSTSERTLH